MIDTAAKIDNFIQWLSDTGRSVKYSPDVCVACIEKVSEYAVRKNISKVPFWEISSWKVLNQIRNKLAENRIFKFSDKKNYLLFDKVGKYYSDFLAEQPSVQIDVVEQIDNKEAEVFESKNIETEHIAIPLQDTDNIVDFANDLANYAFTKPVSIELFGHSSAMRYWAETYVFVINRLYEREQSITQQYFEEQISNADIRPLFALQKETLVSPKELLCGYFVETNFSATNTVKLIKQICDYCGVSANTEIKIIYVRKNSPSTEASKDLENVVRNESNSILDDFSNWLLVEVQLGVATCRSYSSAISVVSRWAVENNIIDGDLFVVDESHTTILRVAYIMSSDSFKKYNAKQHNRFSAALTHYIRFFNSISPNPVPMKATEIETEKYIKVCTNHYHYGFSYESPIEIMRFKGFFETDNSVVCELTDDKIILVLKELGIEFEKKIFFVDLQILTRIEALIESEILKGSSIVYFDCLYEVNEC